MYLLSSCRELSVAGVSALGLLSSCIEPEPDASMGLALIRVSEVAGVCPVETGLDGYVEIPTDLPFRRAKATASFRASARYPGGHFIALGYADDDAHVGMIQIDVPAERGYGIAEYPTENLTQAVGFAEWKDGALDFAGRSVAGYLNYFAGHEGMNDLPGKIYSLVAFDSKDAANADVCRIVAIHASAERERVTPYDPSWLVPRPGLLITAESKTFVPPELDDLSPPSNTPVVPADAPIDPGPVAPPITLHRPNLFPSSSTGSSSPCD